MYHAIVRRKITSAFAGLSAGRIKAITDELSASAVHYFVGTHALSGTRKKRKGHRAQDRNEGAGQRDRDLAHRARAARDSATLAP